MLGFVAGMATDFSAKLTGNKGLFLGVAYTWSKALATAQSGGTNDNSFVRPDQYTREAYYGPSSFDRRQVLAINYVYNTPRLSSGNTFTLLVDSWTDSVWLSVNKTRPIPAEGDVLLTEFTHTGGLAVKAGYDQTVSVTIPQDLQPGTYYITPWTDLFSSVLQAELG